MLIFYTQFTGTEEKERQRFDKIKKKMGEVFKQEQKFKQKYFPSNEKMLIKAGNNWFAVHQFI